MKSLQQLLRLERVIDDYETIKGRPLSSKEMQEIFFGRFEIPYCSVLSYKIELLMLRKDI